MQQIMSLCVSRGRIGRFQLPTNIRKFPKRLVHGVLLSTYT